MGEYDVVVYGLRDNLACLEVLGTRDTLRRKNGSILVSPLYRVEGNSFMEAVEGLINYHNQCVREHNEGRNQRYFGAGSDRGEWVDKNLHTWRIADSLPLLEPEKKLLEGIVGIHNHICHSHQKTSRHEFPFRTLN